VGKLREYNRTNKYKTVTGMGKKTTDLKIEEGRSALRQNLQWISLAILIIGLIACILPFFQPELYIVRFPIELNTPYLLSAIAQSLAAILALVFTATLIVAQLSSRYSHRVLAQYFDIYTVSYISIFVVAVILPIWLLSRPSLIGINTSFILAVICLVLLVPYFLRFRNTLSPEYMIGYVTNQALRKLKANATVEPQDWVALSEIIMSAYSLKDYETFRKGMQCLSILFSEILRIEWQSPTTGEEIKDDEITQFDSTREYYRRFVLGQAISLVRRALDRRIYNIAQATSEDPITTEEIHNTLMVEAKKAIKNNRRIAAEIMLYLSMSIGITGTTKGFKSQGYSAIENLQEVGHEALDSNQKDTVNLVLHGISLIGVQSYNAKLGDLFEQVVQSIGRFGERAASQNITECATEAAARLLFLFGMAKLSDESMTLTGQEHIIDLRNMILASLKNIKTKTSSHIINNAFKRAIELLKILVPQSWKWDRERLIYKKSIKELYKTL
jgi:hypothetical protein